jgi:AraC-like DNA-binding protein
VTEIALRQGFNDIPHFSRQFKARFGLSPTALRGRRRLEM